MIDKLRLHKLIAMSGLASRREAERLIAAGRVSVNDRTVTIQGTIVDPQHDKVCLDGKLVKPVKEKIYLKMNKPRSVVSTLSDPQSRTTILDLLQGLACARGERRIFHIGRLDFASEGLLLLTNDGDLANRLSHPSKQVPRTYRVRLRGCPSKVIIDKIQKGVTLEDGFVSVIDAQIIKYNPKSTWLELTVTEGRNRLIRRLMAMVGLNISRLVRVAYGGIMLGDLKFGETRELTSEEIKVLKCW